MVPYLTLYSLVTFLVTISPAIPRWPVRRKGSLSRLLEISWLVERKNDQTKEASRPDLPFIRVKYTDRGPKLVVFFLG